MALLKSFPPVVDGRSRVIVLGSMPGRASLAAEQYYAHAQNAFWRVMFALWDQPFTENYGERLRFLLDHHVALWDTLAACEREGSLDSNIKHAISNDFGALFETYPKIEAIVFNGKAAQALYLRHVAKAVPPMPMHAMPSTSPAHTLPFAEKLTAWRRLRTMAEEGTLACEWST